MKRLKELEHEPRRLKRMYAELSLENQGLQGRHHKKALPLAEQRVLAAHFMTVTGLPVQRACRVVGRGRVTYDGPWWTGRRAMRGGSPR